MGLDMSLMGEKHLWAYIKNDEENIRKAIRQFIPNSPGEVTSLTTEAAYWRKANAIHKWFVDNVQDGVDECQRADISREQLSTLLNVCEDVLEHPEKGPGLLPTEEGFFFGSTEYGEYYVEYLKDTVRQLSAVLKSDENWNFYYQSSW